MAGVPPKRGEAYTFPTFLTSQADTNIFQVNPTLAAGDVEVSIDGGAQNPIAALPTVSPAGSDQVLVTVSAAEMAHAVGGFTTVRFHDAAGAEWQDQGRELRGVETPIDELVAAAVASIISALLSISPVRQALGTVDLELYRGDTWIQPISGLGDLTGWTRIWLTARRDKDNSDGQSQILIQLSDPADPSDGLRYIAGGPAAIPANGSVTVTDVPRGNLLARLEAVEAAKLQPSARWYYDAQWTDGTDVKTPRRGYLLILTDVTRAVS